jgi:hypothetical protein
MLAPKTLSKLYAMPVRFASHVKSHDTVTPVPSQNSEYADLTEEFVTDMAPKKGIFTERFERWLSRHWSPHDDDTLSNDHAHRFAAYKWFTGGLLGAKPIVKLMSNLFERTQHANFYEEPAKIHENSVFLYKSDQANDVLMGRWVDYGLLAGLPIVLFIGHPYMYLMYSFYILTAPSRLSLMKYFTFRADLLPHTEQVVFMKGGFFGQPNKYIVDIKNLKKVEPSSVPHSFTLWNNPVADKRMVWKDISSGECFVLDTYGFWS